MSAAKPPPSRTGVILLWALRILMAALFLFAGLAKLSGQQMMVDEFTTVGVGQWFRYVTGLLEVIGGIAILAPSVSAYGAALLLLVDIGAFIAQITLLHMDFIHPIVIGALLAIVIYLQRDQLGARS